MFANEVERPVEVRNLMRRSYLPLLKKASLKRIKFHGLRHSAATQLLMAGVHPKIVSERLGHSTISITMDTYSHVLPGLQQEAVSRLDLWLESRSR